MCLGPWGGREGKLASVTISPQVARKPPRTAPVSPVSSQSLRPIAAWTTHHPSLLSLGHTKSFCWLSLLPGWCVCLLLSQSQPVVGQTLPPPGGPHGRHQADKTSLVLTARALLCPQPQSWSPGSLLQTLPKADMKSLFHVWLVWESQEKEGFFNLFCPHVGKRWAWHRCHSTRVPCTPHEAQLALQSLGFLMGLMCHGAEAGQAQNVLALALVQAVDMLCEVH